MGILRKALRQYLQKHPGRGHHSRAPTKRRRGRGNGGGAAVVGIRQSSVSQFWQLLDLGNLGDLPCPPSEVPILLVSSNHFIPVNPQAILVTIGFLIDSGLGI